MIDSCLQGVMGQLYTDSLSMPQAAMALLGDFCFFAGKPTPALPLSLSGFCKKDYMLLIPQTDEWTKLLAQYCGSHAAQIVRYATKKEPDVFDINRLNRFAAALPNGYTMRAMDSELFSYCKQTKWCRDFVAQYPDYGLYQKYGAGMLVFQNNELVSGASSYSGYLGGIEIEIETHKDYRRKGLATACGAALILECLKRGWYPSWDAHNKVSLALAEKLGYHFSQEYTAFEVTRGLPDHAPTTEGEGL